MIQSYLIKRHKNKFYACLNFLSTVFSPLLILDNMINKEFKKAKKIFNTHFDMTVFLRLEFGQTSLFY